MQHALRTTVGTLLLASSASGFAVTYLAVDDGQPASAEISLSEPTLIKVDGGRLVKIRHNPRDLIVEPDASGQAFIKPVAIGGSKKSRSFTVFVQTETVTFPLVLRTADKPTDTLIVREPPPNAPRGAAGSAGNHVRSMKNMVLSAAMEVPPAEYLVTPVNRILPLWKEVRFVHRRQITGPSHIIDHYALTNLTKEELVLNEQEFYRAGVLAVSMETAKLAAGESTRVFIVRRGGAE
jgi:conjugal transfer pilus assembly protein TraK